MFHAHSTDRRNRCDWQGLKQHLEAVAEGAACRGAALGIAPAARLAGLLHDLGKYDPRFQRRLAGAGERVDHSIAGADLVSSIAETAADKVMADLIAYAIAGHHAGLPDRFGKGDTASLETRLGMFERDRLDPAWRDELAPVGRGLGVKLDWGGELAFRLALLGRMIFSCLVDADFVDTEGFYDRLKGTHSDRTWPPLSEQVAEMADAVRRTTDALAARGGPVDAIRARILAHVRTKADAAPGLFTLTVPTGGGKTLASLAFALDHARAHDLRRIIYAIPFTSVVDQTAAVLREILGDDLVLEHHAAIEDEPPARGADDDRAGAQKLRLAMEDWAAPVVVTTHVQLFESLFAARPSRCRKLRNIARSVIVLDEAQTLPRHVLAPTVRVIDALAANWGASVVLCTATQPAFDRRRLPRGHRLALDLEGRELAPDPPALAHAMRRVTLEIAGEMTDDDLVAVLAGTPQALVIVNSRGHALTLFRAVAAALEGAIHLTTRQYAAHRREILNTIRDRLKNGKPCRVVATSLVEAGIDLDFPRVLRAEAGLDQIAQAAGRCNREGRRKLEDSRVTVFRAPANPPPREIAGLTGDFRQIAANHPDLLSPDAITAYFEQVYWRLDLAGALDEKKIYASFRADKTGTDFPYRTVARDYRMIAEGMVPVVVARDPTAHEAVEELGVADISSGRLARRLQPYLVQVPPRARARLMAAGHVAFAHPELRRDQFAVLLSPHLYDPTVGLLWEDPDYLACETLLI